MRPSTSIRTELLAIIGPAIPSVRNESLRFFLRTGTGQLPGESEHMLFNGLVSYAKSGHSRPDRFPFDLLYGGLNGGLKSSATLFASFLRS